MGKLLLGLALVGAVMGCAGGDDDAEPDVDVDGDGRPGCTDRFLCLTSDAGAAAAREREAAELMTRGVRWSCVCTDLSAPIEYQRHMGSVCAPAYGYALLFMKETAGTEYSGGCDCCYEGGSCKPDARAENDVCDRDPDNPALCLDPRAKQCDEP